MKAFFSLLTAGGVLTAAVFFLDVSSGRAGAQSITEFSLPTANSGPWAITVGPDNNLWFTELGTNKIGRITPGSPNTITEFPVPTAIASTVAGVHAITAGPDGNIWFTEVGKIGRILTANPNTITEFPVPTAGYNPMGITAGSDGNIWFTERNGSSDQIGRILTASPNTITEFPLPTPLRYADGITAGPDNNLWFTEEVGKIGRILTASPNTITEFPLGGPFHYAQGGITVGQDNNLWFTDFYDQVGRITPGSPNTITEFPVPTASSAPAGITAGPDGNIWFTEFSGYGNQIGRILTASPNTITEFPVPTASSFPASITAGPDGNIWFTEEVGNKIGRVNLSAIATATPTATPTNVALHTNTATPTPPNTPLAVCAATPLTGCRSASKSLLLLKKNATDTTKDKLVWKWVQGEPTTKAEFGDPTSVTDYTLCLYDANGSVLSATVPADAAKWSVIGTKGFKYEDPGAADEGIQKIVLKASAENKSKAVVKGKGGNLRDPVLGNLSAPVTAQLVDSTTPVCWEGVYGAGNIIRNTLSLLKAKAGNS